MSNPTYLLNHLNKYCYKKFRVHYISHEVLSCLSKLAAPEGTTTHGSVTLGILTLGIKILDLMTPRIRMHGIMTLSIMIRGIMTLGI